MEDEIVRTIDLNAPVQRVWKALTDHEEFGAWFRLSLHGPFKLGELTSGETRYPGHEGLPFWAKVVAIDEPRLFSFVWPMDESIQPDDPDLEQKTTLVEFNLEPTAIGSKLTVRESGFNTLPENRRLQAFRDNQGGWDQQTSNIKRFVE
ncbi:SRPBCC family protein [Cognatiyoonia sp. IB215182]|uniref:SRPBCC family protein n=1 Tax=Cognatiyoonia sp. IB215182 TaxID=3097353 RepID=UPI002A0C73E1|nr:SRPBCC family protein [Cognatiyoonia sp. IB215182]MDX8355586.1 SRPBCC family protein [Cognatiyoonia sp. IB215182]